MTQGMRGQDAAAEYRRAHSAAVVFDLSQRGKVEVSEADAASFLHNLSSNDVLHLPPGTGCEAFLLTQKAKVVAYLTLFHLRGTDGKSTFWLDLAPGSADKVIAHLDRYLISERVAFTDHTPELAQFYVAGPRAEAALRRVFPDLAHLEDLHASVATACGIACQVRRHDRLGLEGFDVLCTATWAEPFRSALAAADVQPACIEVYEAMRIEGGTPAQGSDVNENTFAPEVDRAAHAISYTKGCYLGQEPIVMARDRGQVNRFLRRLALPDGPAAPDSMLFRDGKEVGRVTSSARVPTTGAGVALGFVRRGSQEPGTALQVDAAGVRHPCHVTK